MNIPRLGEPPFWWLLGPRHERTKPCTFCRFVLRPVCWWLMLKILILFSMVMSLGFLHALGLWSPPGR